MTTLSVRVERRTAGPSNFSGRGHYEQLRCDGRNERAGVALSVDARGDGGSDVASSFLLQCVSPSNMTLNFATIQSCHGSEKNAVDVSCRMRKVLQARGDPCRVPVFNLFHYLFMQCVASACGEGWPMCDCHGRSAHVCRADQPGIFQVGLVTTIQ